ncbi:MAG: hypothetical protein NW215_13055 [Hyphomicrobiales bacterium]|nr:hypothetical protein [Hyphomicrobiales bacterium]
MRRTVQHIAAILTAVAAAGPPPVVAQTAVTIDECKLLKETDVREKIRELTDAALDAELKGLNYRALVNERWPAARMDERIDKAVDDAIAQLRSDTTWLDRAYSNVSRQTAERYATAVAERAYSSPDFKDALAEIADAVGKAIGDRVERSAEQVSGPVIACVQSTLQNRYGDALAQVFARETKDTIRVSPSASSAKIDVGDLALQGGATISGIILVVTRQVIARMVAGIGARIAGAIATRIVSTFAGLVGVALIASDIYNAGEGVFPLIAERMKAADSKDLIKSEIVRALETEVGEQLQPIGRETAERIHALWLDFRQKYDKLLALADQYPAFATFLRDRKIDQLGRLGRIVAVILAQQGEKGVEWRVADGSLALAVLELDDPGVAIAEDAKSVDQALKWAKLSRGDLEAVARYELHRVLKPDAINADELKRLISLNDKTAVGRIARLDASARSLLLGLPEAQLRSVARMLTEAELTAFSDYQRRLSPEAARVVAKELGADPAVMRRLSGDLLRAGVIASRDQLAALDMALRPPPPIPDLMRVLNDFDMVTAGRVDFRVFWDRHTVVVIVFAVMGLILLLWLRRLAFGRGKT